MLGEARIHQRVHFRGQWPPQECMGSLRRCTRHVHCGWTQRVHAQVRTARSQWLAEEEGGIDDCTAIVCILQQGGRARRTGSVLPTDAAKAATAISRSVLIVKTLRAPTPTKD